MKNIIQKHSVKSDKKFSPLGVCMGFIVQII